MKLLTHRIAIFLLIFVLASSAYGDPEQEEQIFVGEILRVQILSKYSGTAKLAAVDPRFVVELRLTSDVGGLGKQEDSIAFAIHSPARDLLLSDYSSTTGKTIRLRVSRRNGAKRYFLRRALTKAQQDGADQPATAPESKAKGSLESQPETEGRPQ